MNKYEVMFIVKPAEEEATNAVIEKVEALISLSAYARQFLGQMDKPDVDYIEGLSPAISIDQKTTSRN
ncbi:hypothetical protein NE583_10245, partial [Veillonella parvula]|uniref:hypothetical protein n=1 Tax=Veillonella parvula TaxID=29466 RepID=UPI00210D59BE